MYRRLIKRLVDLIASLVLLVLTSPIMMLTLVVLVVQNRGTPFFIQIRPGQNQEPFEIIKFKTMTDRCDATGQLLPDNERETATGRLIRKLSLDELPQLVNVLKGNMSLVGPRPLLFKYIPLYSSQQNRRHEVKPGLTGLAQINGRNSISWSKKFEYDVYYVDNVSFWLDVKILLRTFWKVFKMEGINESVRRPMQPFNGSN